MENSGHKNLRPAQAGEIRNPKGRPKGSKNTATIIRKILEAKQEGKDPFTGKFRKMSQLEMMIFKQLKRARDGDTRAFIALLDRMDGKPKQLNEHSGVDGKPIETKSEVGVALLDPSKLSDAALEELYKQGGGNG